MALLSSGKGAQRQRGDSTRQYPQSAIERPLTEATRFLTKHGIPQSRFEAEVLLAHVTGAPRLSFYAHPEQALAPEHESSYWDLVRRRAKGEPLAYLCGEKEFFSLPFFVDRSVLIPRPETELIVEAAIESLNDGARMPRRDRSSATFFDVGTGSGAIAVAVLANVPGARATASDISPDAIDVARRNAERHGVADRLALIEGDLFADSTGEVDLVVSNPPYVADTERDALPRDVRDYEPAEALFAGRDGLAVVRRLIAQAPDHLLPGGRLIFEIGYGKEDACFALLESDGRWADLEARNDLAGIARVVLARKSEA